MSKKTSFAFLALFALLLASQPAWGLFEGTFTCLANSPISPVHDYDKPLTVALLAMALLIAIAYMVGSSIQKPEIIQWAKSEAITLAWSLVLIIAVFGAFQFMCNLSGALLCASTPPGMACAYSGVGPADAAGQYLDSLITSYGLPIATSLVQGSINDQFAAMPFAYWGFPWDPGGGGGVAYLANHKAWSAQKEVVASLYIPLMMSIKVQRMAFELLFSGVAGMLLPAALLLRVLFFSRDIGNFLLALSFSIYFFLPLTYVMAQQATANVITVMGSDASNPFILLDSANDPVVGDSYQKLGFLSVQAILIPNIALVVLITATMALNKAFKGFSA